MVQDSILSSFNDGKNYNSYKCNKLDFFVIIAESWVMSFDQEFHC